MVKVTGEDWVRRPARSTVPQVKLAPASSFPAENLRVEEVVERPVTGSTCTEASITMPGRRRRRRRRAGRTTRSEVGGRKNDVIVDAPDIILHATKRANVKYLDGYILRE